MAQQFYETKFKDTLYEKCQKFVIPNKCYYKTIEDLKIITEMSTSMSRHQYNILQKYERLTCG
jgi:hypothetical protein